MRKMKENPHEHKSVSHQTMEGYLFVQEKRKYIEYLSQMDIYLKKN